MQSVHKSNMASKMAAALNVTKNTFNLGFMICLHQIIFFYIVFKIGSKIVEKSNQILFVSVVSKRHV